MKKIKTIQQGSLIVCGDFNITPDPRMDITSKSSKKTPSLASFLKSQELYDVWRCTHANEKDFTLYSYRHCTYTRIDLFLIDRWLLPKVLHTKINDITWSDHASVLLTLRDDYPNSTYVWHANPQVIQTHQLKSPWKTTCPIISRSTPHLQRTHLYSGTPIRRTLEECLFN